MQRDVNYNITYNSKHQIKSNRNNLNPISLEMGGALKDMEDTHAVALKHMKDTLFSDKRVITQYVQCDHSVKTDTHHINTEPFLYFSIGQCRPTELSMMMEMSYDFCR